MPRSDGEFPEEEHQINEGLEEAEVRPHPNPAGQLLQRRHREADHALRFKERELTDVLTDGTNGRR